MNMSLLQFANDTILFCPNSLETLVNYRRILDYFGVILGLRINYEKSTLVLIHCDSNWVTHAKSILGCMEVTLPIRYLGIPLGPNPNLIETWQPVLEKIRKRLSSWKVNVLSKARQVVLIKSILNNLPSTT